MDAQGKITPGRQAREFRRERIRTLLEMVKGFKGWRDAFFETYPGFNSNEGINLINAGFISRTTNPDLLAALEEWIPKIQNEKPDWFTKSENLAQA